MASISHMLHYRRCRIQQVRTSFSVVYSTFCHLLFLSWFVLTCIVVWSNFTSMWISSSSLQGLTGDADSLYVCARGNERVIRFNKSTELYIDRMDFDPALGRPTDAAIGCESSSQLFVVLSNHPSQTTQAATVAVVDWTTKSIVRTFGSYGVELYIPQAIAIDCTEPAAFVSSNLYVRVFNTVTGVLLRSLGPVSTSSAFGLALDVESKLLYIAIRLSDPTGIVVYNSSTGAFVRSFGTTPGKLLGTTVGTTAIALRKDRGTVFVVEQNNNRYAGWCSRVVFMPFTDVAFAACASVSVWDIYNGTFITAFGMSLLSGPVGIYWDTGLQRLYVSTYPGTVFVLAGPGMRN